MEATARRAARWEVANLHERAAGISASRRTDIPALFAAWFEQRLRDGWVERIPAGPPRRLRRSLRVEDVTHFTFWSKWPRPFFRVLASVLDAGYPVLWNVTVTGLGASAVEPHVPPAERVVASVRELARMVPPAGILWRYDPIFLSQRFDTRFHVEAFRSLASRLAGCVDRVAVSFVTGYARRVGPDLRTYQRETGDALADAPISQKAELVASLAEIGDEFGIPLTVCCLPDVRKRLRCPRSGCNAWSWATRVHPQLCERPGLRNRPCRGDCGCSEEVDIGCYDTCVLGCRYSYGSASLARARRNFERHDPTQPCLIP